MSTVKVINVQHPSAASPNITGDANGNITFGGTAAMASSFVRNRIINGAMVIDQRNAGASVTGSTSDPFIVDRWKTPSTQNSKLTFQQNQGSATPPTGFTNYLGATSSSAYTPLSTDILSINQQIEGFNIADFGWGTASALSVTLSFWVRSSLTGTFSGALANSAHAYCYPFTFTISGANTWEYKTVVIPGPTSGTWLTNNGLGIRLSFDLGCGSNLRGTAGAWTSTAGLYGATGSVQLVATNGATFYITGVQLEVGTVATPFEREIYSQTLAKCQRYYQTHSLFQSSSGIWLSYYGGSAAYCPLMLLPIAMRTTATISFNTTAAEYYSYAGAWTSTTIIGGSMTNEAFYIYALVDGDGRGKLLRTSSGGTGPIPYGNFSAEL